MIRGNVMLDSKKVAGVYIQAVSPVTNNIIAFDASGANGNYEIKPEGSYQKVIIKISHIGYYSIDTVVALNNDTVTLNFNLQVNHNTLAPVNITVTRPIEINGDTTSFNVASFKKDEKSVEALLKKLPGFEVDDKGKIKFKNKAIKTILLDGDDVVKSDYKVLSKNITPDMVDKIQAIENYNSNELLAGITKSDETVLNLKINKKFKGVVYIKTSVLTTVRDSLHDIENTGLAIFKNLKIVNAFNKNNTGKYTSTNSTGENGQGETDLPDALINNDYLYHLNDESNEKFNNAWTNNFNLLYKRKGVFEINARYVYFSDIQKTTTSNITEYINISPVVKLEENMQKRVTAKTHTFNLSGKIYTSRLSFLTLKVSGGFARAVLQNDNKNTFNTLSNHNSDTCSLFGSNLYFIRKLNLKNALEIETGYSYKAIPQSLVIAPGLYNSFFNTNGYDSIWQAANSSERSWKNEARITGYNSWMKYKFSAGYQYQNMQYTSAVTLLKTPFYTTADSLANAVRTINRNTYFTAALEKSVVQQKLNIRLENNFQYAFITPAGIKRSSRLFFNPAVEFNCRAGRTGNLSLRFAKSNSFAESKHYVSNYFFTDYNTLEKNNVPEAVTENKKVYTLNYVNINLFKNQRAVFISSSYTRNSDFINHFSQNYTDYYIERNEKLQAPVTNISWLNYATYSRFVRSLNNTLKVNLFYVFNKTTTLQNDLGATSFVTRILSPGIAFISKFKGALNYEIKAGLNYTISNSRSAAFINSFKNSTYNASAIINLRLLRNINSRIDLKYTRNTTATYYLDAAIDYEFSKKDLTISAGGQNLLNNNNATNYYATEFFTRNSRTVLFPRFIYLKLACNFSFKL